jgi:hypothetical protein
MITLTGGRAIRLTATKNNTRKYLNSYWCGVEVVALN